MEIAQIEQLKTDETSIAEVLRRYEEAYEKPQTEGVGGVWPSLGKRDLVRVDEFFRMAKQVQLRLEPVGRAQIDEDAAVVQCRRTLRFSDNRGEQRSIQDVVTIALRKSGERWTIGSVR